MRRHPAAAAALVLLVLAGTVPAYARVFTDTVWLAPSLVAGAVAATLAAVLHRLGRGALLTTAVSGVTLVSLLPWLLSSTTGPVLPRPELLADLAALWSQGLVELAETPAPTPTLAGLLLLLVVAVWVVTHLAVVMLLQTGRAGPPLVLLTALWVVPLVVPLPPVSAVPAAVAFLLAAAVLLLATTPRTEATRGSTFVPLTGVVMAAAVIAAATVVPTALPGYDEPGWITLGQGGSQPRGYQPIVDVADRLRLPEERDVLRLQSTQRTYLRLAGLDRFDGFTWRLGEPTPGGWRPDPQDLVTANGPLPPEEPAASTVPVFVDVEVLALENIYVPVPYQPIEVLGPQRDEMVWSTEGGFLAAWEPVGGRGQEAGIREGVDYRVEAARPAPTYDELLALGSLSDPATAAAAGLDPAELSRWTDLPRDYPRLREQTEAVYAAADARTTVDQALALQDWFVGPDGDFEYDLEVAPLRDDDALERFVLEDRVGYCEYFATAMAVMLRETGIPARVAVGFLPGRVTLEPDPASGRETTEFTVSTSDAHAWVEVLFPGYGWVTFEPTPRSDETQIVPTAGDLAPIENVRERRERELDEVPDLDADDPLVPEIDEREGLPPLGADDQAPTDAAEGSDDGMPFTLLVLFVIGSLILAGGAAVRWRRRTRGAPMSAGDPAARVLHAQRELLATARRHGIGRRRHETIREVVARWRAEGRIDGRGARFAQLAQAAAFGGEVTPEEAAAAEQLAAELRERLRASVSPRDRRLAPVRVPVERFGTAAGRARNALRSRPDARPPSRPPRPATLARRRQQRQRRR
jgi:transglutaminase-like putative cysteine protease